MRFGARATAPAIALVAFSITLGVSFWQQRRSRPPDPVAVTVPDAHTEEPIVQAPPAPRSRPAPLLSSRNQLRLQSGSGGSRGK